MKTKTPQNVVQNAAMSLTQAKVGRLAQTKIAVGSGSKAPKIQARVIFGFDPEEIRREVAAMQERLLAQALPIHEEPVPSLIKIQKEKKQTKREATRERRRIERQLRLSQIQPKARFCRRPVCKAQLDHRCKMFCTDVCRMTHRLELRKIWRANNKRVRTRPERHTEAARLKNREFSRAYYKKIIAARPPRLCVICSNEMRNFGQSETCSDDCGRKNRSRKCAIWRANKKKALTICVVPQ